jgi:hypothetical protein
MLLSQLWSSAIAIVGHMAANYHRTWAAADMVSLRKHVAAGTGWLGSMMYIVVSLASVTISFTILTEIYSMCLNCYIPRPFMVLSLS